MIAIVLVAGQGTRLRPYTDDKPKCMVKLGGKSLLQRQLEILRFVGIDDIVLVGGYRSDRLIAEGVELAINPRFAETNMVSSLFCAESWMTFGEDFVITYGDIVYEPHVLTSLIDTNGSIAVSVHRKWKRLWEARMGDPLRDVETLRLADGNRIVEIGKKPQTLGEIQGQYMGLIKVCCDASENFRAQWHGLNRRGSYHVNDCDNIHMTSFIQHLIDSGSDVRAAFTDDGWIEIDTVEDLACYEQMQQAGTLAQFVRLM